MKIKDKRKKIINKAVLFIDNLIEEVYVLGTNRYGLATAVWLESKNIKVIGYINDKISDVTFEGLPVVKSNIDFSDKVVINCIVEGRSIDAQKSIDKCNPSKTIDYFALQFGYIDDLPSVDFLIETDSILDNVVEYCNLYYKLQDETSKQHFENITNFRLNRDIDYLNDFEFKIKSQYFENFINLNEDASFIDGGGFDGETTKLFTQFYPKYKHIYYFEPTEQSFINSIENLIGIERISFKKNGLWDKKETLIFNSTLGSANKISIEGNVSIEAVSIDEVIDKPVDYIKMDIEGAEYNALLGAKKYIEKYKPKLAICVYHNQSDFIRIPNLVLQFNQDYKIYLRHYTQGVFETVMYFV